MAKVKADEPPVFKKLTVHSITEMKKRKFHAKIFEDKRNESLVEENNEETLSENENENDKRFKTGKILPHRFKKILPSDLYGLPIEEFDESNRDSHASLLYKTQFIIKITYLKFKNL